MRRREWTIWLVASLVFGASFWLVAGAENHGPLLVAWKGAGVALLAVHALVFAIGHPEARRDAALLAMVMAFGAGGDVAIERSLTAGAGLFLVGHVVAIALYAMNRRRPARSGDLALAAAILLIVPAIAWTLPTDRSSAANVALYATGLSAMTAMAWLSQFPRGRVATGALLFAASDLLIFARMGPLAGSMIPRLLVWPLYYFGQFLICTRVLAGLTRRPEA
ncbi:lysoplasmalogenase family protein [Novosphingobium sp.]|uniref:lysoplasmalogenase family protein n=1 Tax=Novosphingobium sp. TaxID=1874826 RepID=UPI0025CC1608|nr:lysoplasmalogenase family protein [Novosphingobium sp.]